VTPLEEEMNVECDEFSGYSEIEILRCLRLDMQHILSIVGLARLGCFFGAVVNRVWDNQCR